MNETIYIIYIVVFSILALSLLLLIAGKWIFMGVKVFYAKLRYKQDAGLILFISRSQDVAILKVADLSKNTYDYKGKIYPIEQRVQGKLFGLPYVIKNIEDAKTYGGIYYPVSDKEGKPVYYKDDTDNLVLDKYGEPIPKLSPLKSGATFSPELIKSIILDMALTAAIKDLFKGQNQIRLFLLVAMGAAIAAAYFGFDITQNQLPMVVEYARTAAQCGVTP